MGRLTRCLFAVAVIAASKPSISQHEGERALWTVINPLGWEIPVHSKVSNAHPNDGFDINGAGIEDVAFSIDKSFRVPHDYLSGEALVVYDLSVSAKFLHRISFKGKPFAYTAQVFGTDIATAFRVWWVDEDGSGRYTKLVESSDVPRMPAWLTTQNSEKP